MDFFVAFVIAAIAAKTITAASMYVILWVIQD